MKEGIESKGDGMTTKNSRESLVNVGEVRNGVPSKDPAGFNSIIRL